MKRRSRPDRRALLVTLLPLLGGCMLGPNYQRPKLEMPVGWRDQTRRRPGPRADPATLANTPWWDLFRDPELQELHPHRAGENQDLMIAVERIVEAKARLGFVRADLFPKVDLTTDSAASSRAAKAFPNTSAAGPERRDALRSFAADVVLGDRPVRPHPPRAPRPSAR